MKILITGGCGFVGSNLAIYFKKNKIGSKIDSLDNLSRSGALLNFQRLKKNKIKNFKKLFDAKNGATSGLGGVAQKAKFKSWRRVFRSFMQNFKTKFEKL